jgi:hypothetical protein
MPSGLTTTPSDPTEPGPPHTAAGLRCPPQGRPHRHPAQRQPLPHPTRHHRPQRRIHAAPQQPPTPHRHRPPTRRHRHPRPGPRPTHPSPDHRRRTTPRTPPQPKQGLPTTTKTVNDVPRHPCTMSRDITCGSWELTESPRRVRRVRRLHQLRKRWGLGHGKIEISAGAAGACGPDGRRGTSEL